MLSKHSRICELEQKSWEKLVKTAQNTKFLKDAFLWILTLSQGLMNLKSGKLAENVKNDEKFSYL